MILSFSAQNCSLCSGEEYLLLLRYALRRARVRVWVQQFLIDVRPFSDRENRVRYLLHALAEAKTRSLDVRLLVPRIASDNALPYDVNEPAVRFLVTRGVDVRRYAGSESRPYHHAKVNLIDEDLAIVGNINWTPNALGRKNIERAMAVRSEGLCHSISRSFVSIWDHAATSY